MYAWIFRKMHVNNFKLLSLVKIFGIVYGQNNMYIYI